ncbi:MAG: phosphodiester glycosidase family protein [Oscillospiraceae bacterium]|nr:phosphodiester glycosidase family protein [Oscillospiraceae bacterium]
MKKILLAFIFILALAAPAAYGAVYTYDETEPVTKGVELRRIRRFYGDSWLNILCVKADLKEEHVKLGLLKGSQIDSLSTVGDMVQADGSVVAAANADFFDAAQGFSLGIEIKDGELLQSQLDENMAAGFYDGARLALGYMSMNMSVTAPSGEVCPVKHLNKHVTYYGDAVMFTSGWNKGLSPAPGGEVAEIVVDNGIITEFRRNMPPAQIPENGFVLAVSEGSTMFFANNFSVGDELRVNVTATPSIDGVKTAFGGGTMLLSGGQKTPYTHTIGGRNPRTCIGTNADGTVVYIIAVDGRQRISRGATMDELVDIALELGCVNALNLDGGGSTRMLASTFWNSSPHVVNSPSENRRVINAVSIVSDAPDGEAVGLRLRAAADAVLLGDSVTIESRFYDENENPVWNSDEAPVWNVYGVSGAVENGEFYPYSAGTAVITASYKGTESAPVTVEVIGMPGGISVPESLHLKPGESYQLIPEVYSASGAYAYVKNPGIISAMSDNPAAADISGGIVSAYSEGHSVLTLEYNGFYAFVLVTVGAPATPAPDVPENTYMDNKHGYVQGGNSFGIFAYSGETETLFDQLLYRRGLRDISASTSYGILGKYNSKLLPKGLRTPIMADNFSAIDKGFALIISLPRSGRLSDSNWIAMANAMASTAAQNVIVLTNTTPNGQTDTDTEVFYDYMDFISKSKNVFIVQSGERNSSHLRGNVCFITLADSSLPEGVMNAADKASTLLFTMNGGECMFMFKDIFDYPRTTEAAELPFAG